MTIELKTPTEEDIPRCAEVMYEAFRDIAAQHNFPPDFPNPDVASGVLGMLHQSPGFEGTLAVKDGEIVGSIFLSRRSPVGGISVLTIDPKSQNRGVGRQLMRYGMDRLEQCGHTRQQLVQAAYHNRSICLYAKLGFIADEALSTMTGPPISAEIPGREVRSAVERDMERCNELCANVHGFDRRGEVEEAVKKRSALVVEKEGRITGYTTGVGFIGHGVGETNDDLKALIASADEFAGPGILIPTNNLDLFNWCLDNGLKVVQEMILMDTAPAGQPNGACWPAVLC